ncbi:MAG: hypothetical protein PF440_05610 [Thiomicrorhabdus sp.]|jgi:hypothetical protein|nr:hypothetical protein [Thiomicrorhabdus sp.]
MQRTLTLYLQPLALMLFATLGLSGCSHDSKDNIEQWPTNKECDLHAESCTAQMGESKATLKISPHPIPIARPLGIELVLENLSAEKVELDISGINMYMGYNRVTLTPALEPGRYIGTSMLAFCTNETMQWQVTLMIHKADGSQIQIPYRLETRNR